VRAVLVSLAQQKVQVLWSTPPPPPPPPRWPFANPPLVSVCNFPLPTNSILSAHCIDTLPLGDRRTCTSNSVTLHCDSPSSAHPCTSHGTSSAPHLLAMAWYCILPSVCCAAPHTRNGPKNLLVQEEDQFATCEQSSVSCQPAACI